MTKILVVEDNLDSRQMLVHRLKRLGFNTVTAADGAEAIEAAHSESPSVILMDMNLPVIDGWTAAKMLKSADATKHIPIIGLSANSMDDDRARALDMGCDDYDVKPIEMPRLLDKIKRCTSG